MEKRCIDPSTPVSVDGLKYLSESICNDQHKAAIAREKAAEAKSAWLQRVKANATRFALGAVLFNSGFRRTDAPALRELFLKPHGEVLAALISHAQPRHTFGDVLFAVIAQRAADRAHGGDIADLRTHRQLDEDHRAKSGKGDAEVLLPLGGVLERFGVPREDATAWAGLLATAFSEVRASWRDRTQISEDGEISLHAIYSILLWHLPLYDALGQAIEHERRAASYEARCQSWAKGALPIENFAGRPATADQWRLINIICRTFELTPPQSLDIAAASAWIEAHGGNPRYHMVNP